MKNSEYKGIHQFTCEYPPENGNIIYAKSKGHHDYICALGHLTRVFYCVDVGRFNFTGI